MVSLIKSVRGSIASMIKVLLKVLIVNFGLFFQSMVVVACQTMLLVVLPFSVRKFRQHMFYLMRLWSENLLLLIHWFAPTTFVLTFDESCGPLSENVNTTENGVRLNIPERIILTSNHQTYVDWVYVWCFAYLAKAHGYIKIIMKEALKKLPVYGTKLDMDKDNLINKLTKSAEYNLPIWLVLFPEGTVIGHRTRKRSKAYAEKLNISDNRYTLLPKSTGFKLCVSTLHDSVDYVYDLTIGYSGVRATDIPGKVHTIPNVFFFDRYPKQIHVYVRRFKVSEIPFRDDEAFSQWNLDKWVEKDNYMDEFYRNGSFPSNNNTIQVPFKFVDSYIDVVLPSLIVMVPLSICYCIYSCL